MMVVLYFSCNSDVVVQGGEPCLPVLVILEDELKSHFFYKSFLDLCPYVTQEKVSNLWTQI